MKIFIFFILKEEALNHNFSVKGNLKLGIIYPSQTDIYLKTLVSNSQIKQVCLVPRLNHYVIEVIYEEMRKTIRAREKSWRQY
ncbi:MAG: hypothetical protein SWX82_03855 [Cyanobacteriota bacterium]|nr:hypothetical protein [Cyanobacteriota bacterium]